MRDAVCEKRNRSNTTKNDSKKFLKRRSRRERRWEAAPASFSAEAEDELTFKGKATLEEIPQQPSLAAPGTS